MNLNRRKFLQSLFIGFAITTKKGWANKLPSPAKERRDLFPQGDIAPHLSFLDFGGHGYGLVTATSDKLSTGFVCIPRPLEHSERPDGGPLVYRVVHRTQLWKAGEAPKLQQEILEGNPQYCI